MAKKQHIESEWFEISDRDWLDPRFKPKKLRLLADAQFPRSVVEEIRAAKIAIHAIANGEKNRPDSSVLQIAQKRGWVLLTLDGDFWDDRKYPLQSIKSGIIYIAEAPDQHDRILRAFGLVYGCFAKSYPLDWWHGMKVRATPGEFDIKMRTWQGNIARYNMTLRKGYLVARENR